MYGDKADVTEDEYVIPIGKANVISQGDDVTIVSYGKMLKRVTEASQKLKVINSMIGRNPFIAAPTPIPANPPSEIGVSIILSGPNSSRRPLEAL